MLGIASFKLISTLIYRLAYLANTIVRSNHCQCVSYVELPWFDFFVAQPISSYHCSIHSSYRAAVILPSVSLDMSSTLLPSLLKSFLSLHKTASITLHKISGLQAIHHFSSYRRLVNLPLDFLLLSFYHRESRTTVSNRSIPLVSSTSILELRLHLQTAAIRWSYVLELLCFLEIWIPDHPSIGWATTIDFHIWLQYIYEKCASESTCVYLPWI